jgi:hypothetical protein
MSKGTLEDSLTIDLSLDAAVERDQAGLERISTVAAKETGGI